MEMLPVDGPTNGHRMPTYSTSSPMSQTPGGACWSVLYRCVNRQTMRKGTFFRVGQRSAALTSFMLASHCPEVDTRRSYECGILNFARNSSRTLISANQQHQSLRCLPKVTRLHSNTTRRFQEGISKATRRCDFKYDIYTKAIRRSHDAVRWLHGFVL